MVRQVASASFLVPRTEGRSNRPRTYRPFIWLCSSDGGAINQIDIWRGHRFESDQSHHKAGGNIPLAIFILFSPCIYDHSQVRVTHDVAGTSPCAPVQFRVSLATTKTTGVPCNQRCFPGRKRTATHDKKADRGRLWGCQRIFVGTSGGAFCLWCWRAQISSSFRKIFLGHFVALCSEVAFVLEAIK